MHSLDATALSTWILLVATSTGALGGEAAASFYSRLSNIGIAVNFVVMAWSLIRAGVPRSVPA